MLNKKNKKITLKKTAISLFLVPFFAVIFLLWATFFAFANKISNKKNEL